MSKQTLILALIGLNLFLAAAMVLCAYSPPAAYAQRAGASSGYLAVTARVDTQSGGGLDALFLLDLGSRKMHCFVPNRDQSGKVEYAGSRDLAADFQRQ